MGEGYEMMLQEMLHATEDPHFEEQLRERDNAWGGDNMGGNTGDAGVPHAQHIPLPVGKVLDIPCPPAWPPATGIAPVDSYLLMPSVPFPPGGWVEGVGRYLAPLWALPSWATALIGKTSTAPAPYESRCRCCGLDVHVGDQILLERGEVFCAHCPGGRWDFRERGLFRVARCPPNVVRMSVAPDSWGQKVEGWDCAGGIRWRGARGDLLKTFTCRWSCHCACCREGIAVGDPIVWRSKSVCRTCAVRFGFGGVRADADVLPLPKEHTVYTPDGLRAAWTSWDRAAAKARGGAK